MNPFLGVLQVIKNSSGRAISANGVVWDIEVNAEVNDWGSISQAADGNIYLRYGLWSADEGLVNRPLNPHGDDDPLTQKCHDVIESIETCLDKLPFQLQDSRELWLLDADGVTPIALLAAMRPEDTYTSVEPRYWSSCLGADGVSSQYRFAESRELEQQVKIRAGFNIRKVWIQRHEDGGGVNELTGELVPFGSIPPFLLTEHWEDPGEQKRAQSFIRWIAPSLLTLQMITTEDRQRLEQNLNIQAVSVEHHWRLYPHIIQHKLIQSARVQSRLQTP